MNDCVCYDHGHTICGIHAVKCEDPKGKGCYCTEKMKDRWLGPARKIPITPGQAKITDF